MSNPTLEELYTMSDEELMSVSLADEPPQEQIQETAEEPNPSDDSKQEQEEIPQDISIPSLDEPTDEVDYKAFYESMTKPFKANGREISVSNADDAIRLMQMGADYSKKMEQLKPKKALLKALEDNGLTDKEQLGYLIDLSRKDPKAIAKLVKESEIDLYEFDTDQADEYKPSLEIQEPTQFEEVLTDVLVANPDMGSVLNHIEQWDKESKDILFNEPNLLKVISEQKANGFYDKVVNVIESERLFGRMKDIPFLQAYAQVEAKLQEKENSFTAPRPQQQPKSDNTDKKKSASMPNGKSGSTQLTQADIYKMSDEEIIKLVESGELL